MKELTITEVLEDQNLFGPRFKDQSWDNWRVFLKVLFSEKLTKAELETYSRFTGRKTLPTKTSEAFVIVGRRGGKSLISAFAALYLSCFKSYQSYLAPGERATVMVLAADRRQTRVVMRYIEGFFDEISLLTSCGAANFRGH